MAYLGLSLLLLVILGLSPRTSFWSEHTLLPWVGLAAGGYLLTRRKPFWGLSLLFFGFSDAVGSLELFLDSTQRVLLETLFALLGYVSLALGILQVPGHPPRITLFLLPLGLLGIEVLAQAGLGLNALYIAWNLALLFLVLPKLETLFHTGPDDRSLWGVGLLFLLTEGMASPYTQGQTGDPLHLLRTLGYVFLAIGIARTPQGEPSFTYQALALSGLFVYPILFFVDNFPIAMRILALYGGIVGSLGLLYAHHLEWKRTEEKNLRWIRFLRELARLTPRITQTLSPEAVLIGALEATRTLIPEAVGLEVLSRRGLVGLRTPYSLKVPMNGESAHLYLRKPPKEPLPEGLLSLLGERLRQVLKQVEWGTLALTDPLTGLLNRRGLEVELPKLLSLTRRYHNPLSVALLDIDHFKRINDAFGHAVGDQVLKALGRILQGSLRREDVAVRYGGEEFLLLLYGADQRAAMEVVERIRSRFRAQKVEPIPYPLTLSAGIAGGKTPNGLEEVEEWVLKADYALLRAKETGRDRITLA